MTTQQQQILFDLDDTLIHCNKYFELILSQYADLMMDWFQSYRINIADIRAKQVEIDVAGVDRIGFASLHFPQSLIDTYRFFCSEVGREPVALEVDHLMKLGMSVYDLPIEPYPGMVETLDYLQNQGHELSLYTGGESVIQKRKIEQMKLSDYFHDRIYIRQHKNVEALEGILSSRYFERKRTWMIGNSLRTDIMPAISAGINTVYIKLPNEWAYNIVELKKQTDTSMYTVSSLEDVPRVIHESLRMKHG